MAPTASTPAFLPTPTYDTSPEPSLLSRGSSSYERSITIDPRSMYLDVGTSLMHSAPMPATMEHQHQQSAFQWGFDMMGPQPSLLSDMSTPFSDQFMLGDYPIKQSDPLIHIGANGHYSDGFSLDDVSSDGFLSLGPDGYHTAGHGSRAQRRPDNGLVLPPFEFNSYLAGGSPPALSPSLSSSSSSSAPSPRDSSPESPPAMEGSENPYSRDPSPPSANANNNATTTNPSYYDPSLTPEQNQRRRFSCTIPGCVRRFTSQYTLKVHLEAHRPKPRVSLPCTMGCSERFSRQHDRLRHEVAKHGKICEWLCDECGRFFSTSRTLGNHKCPSAKGGTRWVNS